MKIELLENHIRTGREIEFKYNGKMYSITYYADTSKKDYISFCEFYKEPVDVCSFEALCQVEYDGTKVLKMWESIDEDGEYYIY